ncbi:cytochrome c oxidase subunit 2A [Paenibacillus agricola]|uniref:Cytochrome c oxidase subunit 2A n=1 Tax=Paenibacillus agricola TaxID=2716264 RepID=A0ABX0J893_9BACL|nr:cytochrome c oxidase subunit 2A [Paenibacillus agricola]NHN30236.1 cytochrome c oxidase subunit 2A [Paenibacillus agricola]
MKKGPQHSDESLKGTLVSVMLLGGFLVVTWVAIFILFIARG